METKLYVGNLSYDSTEDDLKSLFSQAGTVTSVDIIKDRESGRSKGFAFVEMSSPSEAEQAIKLFNGYELDRRQLKVNSARPKEERGYSGSGGSRGGSGGGGSYDRRRAPDDRDRRSTGPKKY